MDDPRLMMSRSSGEKRYNGHGCEHVSHPDRSLRVEENPAPSSHWDFALDRYLARRSFERSADDRRRCTVSNQSLIGYPPKRSCCAKICDRLKDRRLPLAVVSHKDVYPGVRLKPKTLVYPKVPQLKPRKDHQSLETHRHKQIPEVLTRAAVKQTRLQWI